ncbi:hypothetical protein GCM10009127_05990 [Alteraurantiacibacter aestuarii]|uniref:OmpR/PhoB-type domain-containing protein n=1 Tax=Alteraurantiacibacter aestuarii TaxID=650004 RepID=A0A844ZQJ9_9SPHN|nr:helix-turn-helix domain-containing protein [Alteraurantiacibacter aestuarii]MXO89077.1 hypothetical protein [Alteraurantiacibacter aestuarii]
MDSARTSNAAGDAYAAEVERLRAAGLVGASGRLRELFDFLADRGAEAQSATQAEIAEAVFGQSETDGDDATVRVYVHRLRKKLDDHYLANPPAPGQAVLEIPAGVYALQMAEQLPAPSASVPALTVPPRGQMMRYWPALGVLALLAAFLAGMVLNRGFTPATNAIWQPLNTSQRPVLVVLGDYYLFGEIDPVNPEDGRLIRDFRVNSAEDLLRMQEAEPDRFGFAEDVGLNYLPFQTGYALQALAPLLASADKPLDVIAASQLTSDMLNTNDVVYIGLLSGMGLLEEITFAQSSLRVGDSYDEIIDRETGQRWMSDEARRLASPAFYRDFAYITRYRAPGGALVTVIASERVTGLRGIGAIVASGDLPDELSDAAAHDGFEALFQITGQQGADLSDRLILARERE